MVEKDTNHDNYVNVLETNDGVKRDVMSIRSFKHEICTYKQNKVALTSFYDNMRMVDSMNISPLIQWS